MKMESELIGDFIFVEICWLGTSNETYEIILLSFTAFIENLCRVVRNVFCLVK